jgi:hypothetical protein
MQYLKEFLLELARTFQLPFVREALRNVCCRDNTKQNTPRCYRDSVSFFPFPLLLVIHYAISLRELESAIQSIKFLQDNHLLLLALNPFCGRVVGRMHLRFLVHGHLWVRIRPTRSLPQQMLHEDFEVLIRKMPEVLKKFPCQGEIFCHLKILRLIKPYSCIRINEATAGMLVQKLLLELECFV